jgi:hypothetical protein
MSLQHLEFKGIFTKFQSPNKIRGFSMNLLQKSKRENCLSFPQKWESSIFNGLYDTLDSRFHGNDDLCKSLTCCLRFKKVPLPGLVWVATRYCGPEVSLLHAVYGTRRSR